MLNWQFAVVDHVTLTVKKILTPTGISITRRLGNAFSEITLDERTDTDASLELKVGSRSIAAYRNAALRFYGQIADPLTLSARKWNVHAVDPRYFLAYRMLQGEYDFVGDASQAAWALVDAQNTRKSLYLRQGQLQPAVTVAVAFADQRPVADCHGDLAGLNDGIWIRVDPVDGVPGIIGDFHSFYTGPSTTRVPSPKAPARASARFEHGDGTLGNITEDGWTVTYGLPMNRVVASGPNTGAADIPAIAIDNTSILNHGILVEQAISLADSIDATTLQQQADNQLSPDGPVTYSITPIPGDDTNRVPRPWDDFDVGDIVPLRIKDGNVDLNANVRVMEFTVQPADDAKTEQLTNLVLATV